MTLYCNWPGCANESKPAYPRSTGPRCRKHFPTYPPCTTSTSIDPSSEAQKLIDDLRAEVAQLRESHKKLHRRVQQEESALTANIRKHWRRTNKECWDAGFHCGASVVDPNQRLAGAARACAMLSPYLRHWDVCSSRSANSDKECTCGLLNQFDQARQGQ